MNQVHLIGRIARDIEVRYTTGTQMAVSRFPIAISRGKKNGEDLGADFPTIVAFGKTAENLERYSGKGLRVAVTGKIQTGSYEKDGQKYYTTEVIASNVEFVDFKGKDGQNANQSAQEDIPEGFQAITDEDIPF